MALVALYGLWKPASVFDNLQVGAPPGRRSGRRHQAAGQALAGLSRPADLVPAELRARVRNAAAVRSAGHAVRTDAQWGQWSAIFAASSIPTFLVYGVLCRKLRRRTLLFWGTVVAIPQFIPLLLAPLRPRIDEKRTPCWAKISSAASITSTCLAKKTTLPRCGPAEPRSPRPVRPSPGRCVASW